MKIILLNGPPRSGKDTLAREIEEVCKIENIAGVTASIGGFLKYAIHALYAVLCGDEGEIPHAEYFEGHKDTPHPFFFNKTPREAYIQGHEMLKSMHGKALIPNLLAEQIPPRVPGCQVLVVSDIGNSIEAMALRRIGQTVLVRVHRDGHEWTDNRVPCPASCANEVLDYPSVDTDSHRIRHWVKQRLLYHLVN